MADFLLELRSEEIPARMQAGARAELEKLFRTAMRQWGIEVGHLTVWSTPRRLALITGNLPEVTAPVSEEIKGPRINAPEQALEGFLRKTGLTKEQLIDRGGVWFVVKELPGFEVREVLENVIRTVVQNFSWPKSMRWGEYSKSMECLRWVRPLQAIVALLGNEIVGQGLQVNLDGIEPGRMTQGHRFHSVGPIAIQSAATYQQQLRARHVIVDHAMRETIIRDRAAEVATAAGLVLVEDEGLVIENAGLTEWPVPLLGRFDAAFLEVPPEVIQLTARANQKYFICRDAGGKLANAFVCTANIVAADGGAAIVAGNRKVLAARLADARFFWEQDRKKTLAQHAEGLARITFHEKLGTLADKVERVAKLARWLVEQGIVPPLPFRGGAGGGVSPDSSALAGLAEQAARLCKADLVTEMVGEFPELQGLMGGYYARAEGLPDEVADAIRDHYKPVGQGDDVPTAPVTVAVSLADKLDTITHFFLINESPTGSKDPFALRRAALGTIALVIENRLRFRMEHVLLRACEDDLVLFDQLWTGHLEKKLSAFFADRLKVQQREAGVRHDLIDAVFALGGEDDLVRLLARVHALQSFVTTEDGTNLLAGYKRAANILKKEGFTTPLPLAGGAGGGQVLAQGQLTGLPTPNPSRKREGDYAPEPAEAALTSALQIATPRAEAAIAAEDFAGAMAALAALRTPIDAFFEEVIVNDPDERKRATRLGLLDQFRAAVHKVADFSLIEG